MVCHVFVLRICVLQVPWDLWLLVEIMMLPSEPPPSAQRDAEISVNGGWAAHIMDFQALRTPYSCEDSVLCV